MNRTQLLQGTLDLLILRILELGPNHGWGISSRLQQISQDGLRTSQGSLYPALHRLEMRGEVRSEMTTSENNRRARVSAITRAGRKRLNQETETWEAFALSDDARLKTRSSRSSAITSNARLRRTGREESRPKKPVVWPSVISEG